jgi:hypothetical protein
MSNQRRSQQNGSSCVVGFFQLLFALFIVAILGSCVASATGIATESRPYSPRTYYENVANVVIQDVKVYSVQTVKSPVINKGSKIAVLNFKSPSDSQGGVLISDIFASLLISDGYQVMEREKIQKLLNEQNLITSGSAAISDLDIAQRLGNLESVDFMVLGAVTLYESKAHNIYLPIKVKDEDRPKYQEQYAIYKDWYVNHIFPFSINYFKSDDEKLKILRVEDGVLSLEELEEELKKYSMQEFRVIGTVGITAKIIDVRTGAIIWTGQAETTDFTLVDGAKRILQSFIKSVE